MLVVGSTGALDSTRAVVASEDHAPPLPSVHVETDGSGSGVGSAATSPLWRRTVAALAGVPAAADAEAWEAVVGRPQSVFPSHAALK